MAPPEFSRLVFRHLVPARGQADLLVANEAERTALAKRFGLIAIDRLEARVETHRTADGLHVHGHILAAVVQGCAVSGAPMPLAVEAPIELAFRPTAGPAEAEIELVEDALDELPLEDGKADLGEAVAQTLFLAIDPYARAPDASLSETRRYLISEEEAAELARSDRPNPFRSLRGV
ncbi:MAG: YceD family protein [Thermaurantiacus sp.]